MIDATSSGEWVVGILSSALVEGDQLAAIVDRLDPQAVAEQLVASFREQIPGYRRLPTPVIAEQILEVARRNVELCFRSIADGREPTAADLEPFMLSARGCRSRTCFTRTDSAAGSAG
jgi:hypothetical protein